MLYYQALFKIILIHFLVNKYVILGNNNLSFIYVSNVSFFPLSIVSVCDNMMYNLVDARGRSVLCVCETDAGVQAERAF